MISLAFLRAVIRYIDDLNIDDFIITGPYLTEKDREGIHNRTAKTLMSYGHPTKDIERIIRVTKGETVRERDKLKGWD